MRFLWWLIVVVVVWPLAEFIRMLDDGQHCLAGWRAKLEEKRREILNRRNR